MRKALPILWLTVLIATSMPAAINQKSPRLREYRHNAVGKPALARSAAGATLQHVRKSPREWGGGPGGFVKRFGSNLGQHVATQSIQFGVAALRHENLNYQRSNLHGKLPRVKYAVKSTFIVPRTNRPGKTVALSRVSGHLGAGMISRAWQPASTAGLGAGLTSGGIGLGAAVGVNVAREFWPRKNTRRTRK